MPDHNSLAVYTALYGDVLSDIAECYEESDAAGDYCKIVSRCMEEGVEFLTCTLPRLGKAFDKALQGKIPFDSEGFAKAPGTQLPILFGWLFKRVFSDLGFILDSIEDIPASPDDDPSLPRGRAVTLNSDVQAIKHIRQLLFMFYKLELPYGEAKERKVLNSFIDTERELSELTFDCNDAILRRARKIIHRVLSRSNPRDIIPKHGPGAVSTGEAIGEKSRFSRLYEDTERVYPFTEYFRVSDTHTVDTLSEIQALEIKEHGTAKVVLVPKDSRGPRIISCEPLEKQWIQQGQQRKLYSVIESHRWTSGYVNFTDQSVNRDLALSSSELGGWVTLDMKDASDRLSLDLVGALFCSTDWWPALRASRSTHTKLPDGTTVRLEKFAPMGSAVCFPVEALTFWAMSVAVLSLHGMRLALARKRVYVYGDDIICREEDYLTIMRHLERFGLRFNRDKCCVAGLYRESCGCDAYYGVDVTPIRLRSTWSRSKRRDPRQLQSYVAFHNAMYERGYYRTCQTIRSMVEDLYGSLPYLEYRESVDYSSQEPEVKFGTQAKLTTPGRVIGWYCADVNSYSANLERGVPMRVHKGSRGERYHYLEVRGYSVSPHYEVWAESGWDALLRSFTCGSTELPPGKYAVAHRSRQTRSWGRMT